MENINKIKSTLRAIKYIEHMKKAEMKVGFMITPYCEGVSEGPTAHISPTVCDLFTDNLVGFMTLQVDHYIRGLQKKNAEIEETLRELAEIENE